VVAHPRAATRAHRLRPLNQPRPIDVEADESGEPRVVVLGREHLAVAAVQDRWRIDDEWWRERPVSRLYFSLLLEDGRVAAIYRELVTGRWAQQNYG
jgi:hypothetical protein